MKKISAIIACYKDAEAIPEMHQRLTSVLTKTKFDYEIIFVNDGSPDNSEIILDKICQEDKKVTAVFHSRNFGTDNAFSSGMVQSDSDAVILLDGDLQDPPELIPDLIAKWQDGYEVVYGEKKEREGPKIMNFFYKLFYIIFEFHHNIFDSDKKNNLFTVLKNKNFKLVSKCFNSYYFAK
tara:strand:- start:3 stop:542 length:540 start_codon:yes stop_codon:yes gene_type:complete